MEIVVATSNQHKLQEIRKILPESFNFRGMSEMGFYDEIPETGSTFHENAIQKARFLHDLIKGPCLADDSGLEVEALNNRPGVFSARYAGLKASSEENVNKLLLEMEGQPNRSARFKTVLALIIENREYVFEGVVRGKITEKPIGNSGFGYDPIFIPDGFQRTYAEMTPQEKNSISHRYLASMKLREFLMQLPAI